LEIISGKINSEQTTHDPNDKQSKNLSPEDHQRFISFYKTHILRITMHAHILLGHINFTEVIRFLGQSNLVQMEIYPQLRGSFNDTDWAYITHLIQYLDPKYFSCIHCLMAKIKAHKRVKKTSKQTQYRQPYHTGYFDWIGPFPSGYGGFCYAII